MSRAFISIAKSIAKITNKKSLKYICAGLKDKILSDYQNTDNDFIELLSSHYGKIELLALT